MSGSKTSRDQEKQNSLEDSEGVDSTERIGLLVSFPFPPGPCLLKCAKGEEGVRVPPDDPNPHQKVSSSRRSTADFLKLN